MSSVTNNINAENHGIKIWTYPTGEVGFSIFFPYNEQTEPDTYARFTEILDRNLKQNFKVITSKVGEEDQPKKEMRITVSNANKDNVTHVSVEGFDKEKVIETFKDALLNPQYYKEATKK